MTLNGVMTVILCVISPNFRARCRCKQLLGLPRDQNVLFTARPINSHIASAAGA